MKHLPLDIARCRPTSCLQQERCARAQDWPPLDPPRQPLTVIDGSQAQGGAGRCCLFIDTRGLALLPEPATTEDS